MEHDPAAAMLLTMAEKDLSTICKMAIDREFPDEIFGFHAQQAVEKAAKAMLAVKGIAYGRTHDLEILFDALVENHIAKDGAFEGLLDLTDFAVQYRYEAFDGLDVEFDRQAIVLEVQEFIDCAKNVCLKSRDLV
jgi:HEPN domain-containing protein